MSLCALGGARRVGKAEKAGPVLSEEAHLGLSQSSPQGRAQGLTQLHLGSVQTSLTQ